MKTTTLEDWGAEEALRLSQEKGQELPVAMLESLRSFLAALDTKIVLASLPELQQPRPRLNLLGDKLYLDLRLGRRNVVTEFDADGQSRTWGIQEPKLEFFDRVPVTFRR